jgi:hypothetical protein
MVAPLASSLLKLQRAAVQITAIDGEIQAFLKRNPYRLARDLDHEAGYVRVVGRVREKCPDWISVLVGEAVHNIRSALDYMVWDLVVAQTGSIRTGNKAGFPVFLSEAGYKDRGKPMLKGTSGKPRAVIDKEQPCYTGEGADSLLWQLQELNNWDKHRCLQLGGASLRQLTGRFEFPEIQVAGAMTGQTFRRPGPFNDGDEFLRTTFHGCWNESSWDVDVDGDFPFDVCFHEVGPVAGRLIVPTLTAMHRRVYAIGEKLTVVWPI